MGDSLTRQEKLDNLCQEKLGQIDWTIIKPNESGDWTSQRNTEFTAYAPLGDKKSTSGATKVFKTYSLGLSTNRDAWCYNYSRTAVGANIRRMIDVYNEQVDQVQMGTISLEAAEEDPKLINWSAGLRGALRARRKYNFNPHNVIEGVYRPFCRQAVYFDGGLNERVSQLKDMYPSPKHRNLGILLTGPSSHFEFTPFMVDALPNLHTLDSCQFFPRWVYTKEEIPDGQLDLGNSTDGVDKYGYRRVDNITDEILAAYRSSYGADVDKDDVFHYVYGLLHSPDYRFMYAADLTKMLPRIPKVARTADFEVFVAVGRQLASLHLGYETAEPYPLTEVVKEGAPIDAAALYRVTKMKYGPKKDKSKLVYNTWVTLERIPAEAHEYMLGPRSGIDWLIDRYQVKTDKKSGIVNDPNDWAAEHANPRYIVDLIKRVTTVSIRTVELVSQLPKLQVLNS